MSFRNERRVFVYNLGIGYLGKIFIVFAFIRFWII